MAPPLMVFSPPFLAGAWVVALAFVWASTTTALLRASSTPRDQVPAEQALRIAGRDEIEAALAEAGEVVVTCEYCGRRYTYPPGQARSLFEPAAGSGGSA